jgi:hypothetical protein
LPLPLSSILFLLRPNQPSCSGLHLPAPNS